MHAVDARGILSPQNGMNPYRGCTHGCVYCDARSACYGMKHAFEDVEVKRNAPELLDDALSRRRARCMVGTGAMCDPYQPLEDTWRLTRRCMEVVLRRGCGFTVQTKSARVLRDLDLLREINRRAKCVVQMTLTTMDESLCRIVEPNVSVTRERVEALCALRDAGIPTVVWLTPILPYLNDTRENLEGLLRCCAEANVRGIIAFGMGLTLREGDREYYYAALDRHFPGLRVRYEKRYRDAYVLPSDDAPALLARLETFCTERGILRGDDAVFAYLRALDDHPPRQISFFDP